jgi:hypothetical protein
MASAPMQAKLVRTTPPLPPPEATSGIFLFFFVLALHVGEVTSRQEEWLVSEGGEGGLWAPNNALAALRVGFFTPG